MVASLARPLGAFALIATWLSACDGDAASHPCAESADLVYCEGDSNCAFDPAAIDCTAGCQNLGKACGEGCGALPGCASFTQDNCETGCNFAKNQACSNVTFGCYTTSDSCEGIVACVSRLQ